MSIEIIAPAVGDIIELTKQQKETLKHFFYNEISDKLEADREIQTLLILLGNQWAISSSGRSISFKDETLQIDWEPMRSGLADHSIPANRNTDAGLRQAQSPYYNDYVEFEILGPAGTGNVLSGAGGSWPADQEVVGVETILGETLDSADWIRYTIRDGAMGMGAALFSEELPITFFPSFNEGDTLEWWLNTTFRATGGEDYYGIFEILEGGRDGTVRTAYMKNTIAVPTTTYGKIKARNLDIVQAIPDPEAATVFIAKGGNDSSLGSRITTPLLTTDKAQTNVTDLTPSQVNQVAMLSITPGLYNESTLPLDLPRWARIYMPNASFSGANTSGASVVNVPSSAGSEIYSVTATEVGQAGLLFDGTTDAGIKAKAAVSLSTGPAIKIVNSAANSFPEIGSVQGVVECVYIDTDTTDETVCKNNMVVMLADRARSHYVNAPNGSVILKGDSVKYGSGVTVGKAFQIIDAFHCAIDYETIQGDVLLGAGDTSIETQCVEGDITIALGATLTCNILKHPGNLTNNGTLNGVIAGIHYGTSIDDNEYLATFRDPGNISNSWEDLGKIVMNGTTDTIDNFATTYLQTTSNSRTVDVRLVDADTELVTYASGTKINSTPGDQIIDTWTLGTALPAGNSVVLAQIQDNGSGVRDPEVSLYFTRTP